jgi:hypothetical protein
MRDLLECVQRKAVLIPMVIEGADASPAITEGSSYASVTDSGAGVYTVAFTTNFSRAPVIVATAAVAATGDELIAVVHTVSASGFVVELTTGGTLTDGNVHLLIVGFDTADER